MKWGLFWSDLLCHLVATISGGGNERKQFRTRMRTTHNSLKFLHLGRRRTEKSRFDIELLLNLSKI